jgi:hypothetical protein
MQSTLQRQGRSYCTTRRNYLQTETSGSQRSRLLLALMRHTGKEEENDGMRCVRIIRDASLSNKVQFHLCSITIGNPYKRYILCDTILQFFLRSRGSKPSTNKVRHILPQGSSVHAIGTLTVTSEKRIMAPVSIRYRYHKVTFGPQAVLRSR